MASEIDDLYKNTEIDSKVQVDGVERESLVFDNWVQEIDNLEQSTQQRVYLPDKIYIQTVWVTLCITIKHIKL